MFDDILGKAKPYISPVNDEVDQENDIPTGPDKQLDPRQVSASLGSTPIRHRGWNTGQPQKRPWRTT